MARLKNALTPNAMINKKANHIHPRPVDLGGGGSGGAAATRTLLARACDVIGGGCEALLGRGAVGLPFASFGNS